MIEFRRIQTQLYAYNYTIYIGKVKYCKKASGFIKNRPLFTKKYLNNIAPMDCKIHRGVSVRLNFNRNYFKHQPNGG